MTSSAPRRARLPENVRWGDPCCSWFIAEQAPSKSARQIAQVVKQCYRVSTRIVIPDWRVVEKALGQAENVS